MPFDEYRFLGLRVIVQDQLSGDYHVEYRDMTPEVNPGLRAVYKDRHTHAIIQLKRVRVSLTKPRWFS